MIIATVEPIHLHVPLDEPIPPDVVRPLVEALDVHLVRVTFVSENFIARFDPDLACLMNINTPADLRSAARIAARREK